MVSKDEDVGRKKVEKEKEVNLGREVRARIGCPRRKDRKKQNSKASKAGDF